MDCPCLPYTVIDPHQPLTMSSANGAATAEVVSAIWSATTPAATAAKPLIRAVLRDRPEGLSEAVESRGRDFLMHYV
jgi:hypothetical protein